LRDFIRRAFLTLLLQEVQVYKMVKMDISTKIISFYPKVVLASRDYYMIIYGKSFRVAPERPPRSQGQRQNLFSLQIHSLFFNLSNLKAYFETNKYQTGKRRPCICQLSSSSLPYPAKPFLFCFSFPSRFPFVPILKSRARNTTSSECWCSWIYSAIWEIW
jgi:hypothetical protein